MGIDTRGGGRYIMSLRIGGGSFGGSLSSFRGRVGKGNFRVSE